MFADSQLVSLDCMQRVARGEDPGAEHFEQDEARVSQTALNSTVEDENDDDPTHVLHWGKIGRPEQVCALSWCVAGIVQRAPDAVNHFADVRFTHITNAKNMFMICTQLIPRLLSIERSIQAYFLVHPHRECSTSRWNAHDISNYF
jgi:hypothetical protein